MTTSLTRKQLELSETALANRMLVTFDEACHLLCNQFDNPDDTKFCTPCTTAILDAAAAEVGQPGPRL